MVEIGNIAVTLHVVLLATAFPALVLVLGLWRAIFARGSARLLALAAAVFAALPLVVIFGDTLAGGFGERYIEVLAEASERYGWLIFALPMSLPLALSALARGRRAKWIEPVHLGALVALAALWALGI